MSKLFLVLVLTALAVTGQTVAVDKIGPFTIHKISNGGKFDRCAATLNGGSGMLRIAWAVGRDYSVSVPSTTPGRAEPSLGFRFGRKVANYDAKVDGPRTWAKLDNDGVDNLMAVKGQIEIQLYAAKYVWPIGAVKMEDVFVKLENCAHKAAGR